MRRWGKVGGQLGIGICLLGLLLLFLGWNGAATYDRVPAQMPYVISGGLAGLALVVLGSALIVVQTARQDRAAMLATLAELRDALDQRPAPGGGGTRTTTRGAVVAGTSVYHRPDCRVLDGRDDLPSMSASDAAASGLSPCRVCRPKGA